MSPSKNQRTPNDTASGGRYFEIDRRRSLLDRHRIQEEAHVLRGFVGLFWMAMLFFAAMSFAKNARRTGSLLTFGLFRSTMSGYFGLIELGIDALGLFVLHLFLHPLASKYALFIVHPIVLWFAVRRTHSMGSLTAMAYLMLAIVFQMKLHSFAMLRDPGVGLNRYTGHLLSPSIVHEPKPVRSERINWQVVYENVSGTVFCWLLAHLLIEHYMLAPLSAVPKASWEEIWFDIYPSIFIPCIIVYLVLFLMLFEFWLTVLAEVLQLADRHFFSDWWNSTSFAEFSRKWNVPVHMFIKEHIYRPLLALGWPKFAANSACFVISAFLHELVLWAALGQRQLFIRHVPILFCFQLLQLPLTQLGRALSQISQFLANLFFWFGMIFAPPLVTILYIRLQ